MSTGDGPVRMERHGAVRVLTLDDGKLNVLGAEMLGSLLREVRSAEADPETRCLLLTGRSGSFSAGLDLAVLGSGGSAARELLLAMGELLLALYESPLRVVAASTGHAVAAGAMLLLVSDRRLGAEGPFRIGFSEVARGMPLPRLPVLLARDRLLPTALPGLTTLGRLVSPVEAARIGFLDVVADPADLLDAALAEAAALAEIDTDAYHETLGHLRESTLEALRADLVRLRGGAGS
ncbi:MAG: crotonase/enoyl-CoA hydratase family protein [Myxococcota bacterium]|nr:crotonase/enoyl-CoA hydratase family protein [Myxococcota bacterium]